MSNEDEATMSAAAINRELCTRLGLTLDNVLSVDLHIEVNTAPTMTVKRLVRPLQLEAGGVANRIEIRSFVMVDRPESKS